MSNVLPDLEKWIEALGRIISPKLMFGVTLICAFLLFAPITILNFISLTSIVVQYRPWIGFGLVASGLLFISYAVPPWTTRTYRGLSDRKRIEKGLKSLTTHERKLVKRFIDTDAGHLILWPHEVGRLEVEGIFFRIADIGMSNGQYTYGISRPALNYIESHKPSFEK